MKRRISDRAALTPIALCVATWTMAGATWTMAGAAYALSWGGFPVAAQVVGILAVPVAGAGLLSTALVYGRFLEAVAEVRRQRAEGGAVQDPSGDQP